MLPLLRDQSQGLAVLWTHLKYLGQVPVLHRTIRQENRYPAPHILELPKQLDAAGDNEEKQEA